MGDRRRSRGKHWVSRNSGADHQSSYGRQLRPGSGQPFLIDSEVGMEVDLGGFDAFVAFSGVWGVRHGL